MHNPKENDYTVICSSCGSEEICDHEDFGFDESLESIDYCEDCCPQCEAEHELKGEQYYDRD
jgi:hypothetical protein